jgi:ankyrin repeat protein
MEIRRESIEAPFEKTCAWLIERPDFGRWLDCNAPDAQGRILWIKGKPGAGKSTLIKTALQHAERSYPHDAVAGFFFNAGGHSLERSLVGLFRSLLHQVLCKVRPFLPLFLPLFHQKLAIHGMDWEWHLAELQEFFLSHIARAKACRTILFVDALDECGESEVRRFVAFAEQLATVAASFGSKFVICLSSRHYPNIRTGKSLSISVEDHNKTDISAYVREKLQRGISDEAYRVLHHEILEKASGVFLWVVLVIEMLIKAEDDGESLRRMQERLRRVPSGLGELFLQTLKRIDAQDLPITVRMMQWVLFAEEPLTLTEFCSALATGTGLPDLSEDLLEQGHDQKERFIRSRSAGLIEVERIQYLYSKLSTVQFMHESIRDFLLYSKGFEILDPSLAERAVGKGHDELSKSCIKYISLVEPCLTISWDGVSLTIDEEALGLVPFGYYASDYVFSHAEKAEAEGVEQVHLIKSFHAPSSRLFECWWHLIADRRGLHQEGTRPTLLQVASYHNLLSCVRILLESGAPVNAEGGKEYPSAIGAAVSRGHYAMARLLLDHGADVNTKSYAGQPLLHLALQMEASVEETPNKKLRLGGLSWLTPPNRARDDMIQLLVAKGANVNATDEEGTSALHLSLALPQLDMARFFLEHGADPNLRNGTGETPIQIAMNRPNEGMLRLLLDHNVDIHRKGRWGQPPLHSAVGKGRKTIQLLLANGARVHARARDGTTALHCAAKLGDEEATSIFLKEGANVSESDSKGETALHVAASNNITKIVQKLLDRGADTTMRTHEGLTPLISAVAHSSIEAMRQILDSATAATADDQGVSEALHEAVSQDNPVSVRLLLEHGADVELPDEYGRTPLHHAVETPRSEILGLLLKHGVNVNAKDAYGKTPLHQAALKNNPAAVQELLNHGADIKARDAELRTALHDAASEMSIAALEELLNRHADIAAKDIRGNTALHDAASKKSIPALEELLNHHADIAAEDIRSNAALRVAALSGRMPAFRLLASYGADVLARNDEGLTALDLAEKEENPEVKSTRGRIIPAFLKGERKEPA